MMKNILLTNDDGFDSKGLLALKDALSPLGRVLVVAPASEKSACGHGLSITKPLRFVRIDDDFYKLDDGTPTDCVYLALNAMYKEGKRPDLIVSGINIGSNMGEDVTYSGTVAGAMEGAIAGISSIAISQLVSDKNLAQSNDFTLAKKVIADLASKILECNPLPPRRFLNINIPNTTTFKGYKTTELGIRLYGNDAKLSRNPRGEEYYWLGVHPLEWEERSRKILSDFNATKQGYVSITPLSINLTSYDDLDNVAKWLG